MVKTFGEFEFDDRRRGLRARGHPVRLTGQAIDLFCLLLERPGELVTREEIHRGLWPDSNVEFDHSLDVRREPPPNSSRRQEPEPSLHRDGARKGYRFIEPVTARPESRPPTAPRRWSRRFVAYAAVAILAALLAILFARTRYDRFVPTAPSRSLGNGARAIER